MWRPLHEAGGGWFWWGAKGSGPAKALWDMMYDRLHNHFGLHNLIWIWSTPEADWYPGNAKVDIMGYDSYPGAYNYTPQKNMFDQLYNITTCLLYTSYFLKLHFQHYNQEYLRLMMEKHCERNRLPDHAYHN